jgi:hypothetical protein
MSMTLNRAQRSLPAGGAGPEGARRAQRLRAAAPSVHLRLTVGTTPGSGLPTQPNSLVRSVRPPACSRRSRRIADQSGLLPPSCPGITRDCKRRSFQPETSRAFDSAGTRYTWRVLSYHIAFRTQQSNTLPARKSGLSRMPLRRHRSTPRPLPPARARRSASTQRSNPPSRLAVGSRR